MASGGGATELYVRFSKNRVCDKQAFSMSSKRILWRRTLSDFGAGDDTDSPVSSVQIVMLQKQGVGNDDQMIITRYCAGKNKRM